MKILQVVAEMYLRETLAEQPKYGWMITSSIIMLQYP